ncbi:MAG: hypothetical protein ACREQI_14920 [Candidatus Binataceae bacterium]
MNKDRTLKGRGQSSRPFRAGIISVRVNPARCAGLISFGAFSADSVSEYYSTEMHLMLYNIVHIIIEGSADGKQGVSQQ